jgi:intein/homing endonuclease
VSFIYTGTEDTPLVHVVTGNGFDLKLTQGHPVITSEGVRLARFLKVGDVLQTSKGPSPIEAVDRVAYDGKVYNLSLAATQPEEKLDADRETFFGNGILVGGNEMQWRYDRPDAQVVATALPPPVPHMSEMARALLAERFGPQPRAQ